MLFTIENLWALLGVAAFAAAEALLALAKRRFNLGFTMSTAAALAAGIAFGIALQAIFGAETAEGAGAVIKKWINIPGQLFTKGLQFVIVPLVAVSIINAMGKFSSSGEGLRKAARIVGFLLLTTAVSALVSIAVVKVLNVNAGYLIAYKESASKPADMAATILNLVPNNLVGALASNSVLPVVFTAGIIGFAWLSLRKAGSPAAERFGGFLDTAYSFVLSIVGFVIDFTPYAVLAIITVRVASGSGAVIAQLGYIIMASYVMMLVMFVLHLAIGGAMGLPPLTFLRKTGAALLFAFSSRSSAATVPLTIRSMRSLGVGEANADLAAALGTCIGQNGCAGIYSTMVAILIAQVQGWNVWSAAFLVPLVIYVIIASIGTAGVGGGATNVSLVIMAFFGLPVELVAILVSVDFIIDMGRTLLNVSDSVLSGFLASRLEGDIDEAALAAL